MKYVVAVSGGVDSMVLLDKMREEVEPYNLIVAHFDHGIRPESADDAKFVRDITGRYNLEFVTRREELGPNASEELARDRRYVFLREIADKHQGVIVTGHHGDDVIETIAINLVRGTGWRGLAVLGSPNIERPLLDMTKVEIIEYAETNLLEWREDSTNHDTKYLRNDLRQKLKDLDDGKKQVLRKYRERQCFLRKEIDNEAGRIIGASPYSRYLLINAPQKPALELLRTVFMREIGYAPTRPQMKRALLAIKTFHADRRFEVFDGVALHFTKTHFVVEHRQ